MDIQGQAFSVFELMIAAIVAVAILFVLLPIISGGFSFNTAPGDAISNALSAKMDGGNSLTQDFTLNSGDILKSDQFSSDGIDAHSIVFAIAGDNKFPMGKGDAGLSDTDSFSYFKYTGTVPMSAKAMVYCDQTGESLISTLDLVDEEFSEAYHGEELDSDSSPDSLITDSFDGAIETLCGLDDYQPCCAVIIMRK